MCSSIRFIETHLILVCWIDIREFFAVYGLIKVKMAAIIFTKMIISTRPSKLGLPSRLGSGTVVGSGYDDVSMIPQPTLYVTLLIKVC